MVDIWKIMRGIAGSIFGIGTINVKDNSGVVEFRNDDDSDYVRAKVAAPTDNEDAVALRYFNTKRDSLIVSGQADCSSALPTNTGTKRILVVTTSGSGTSIGDLLYDNGTSTGNMEILAAVNARVISTQAALTGGAIELEAYTSYIWNSSAWTEIGDTSVVSGAIRTIDYAYTTTTANSTSLIPANAIIYGTSVLITTAYNTGATIEVGNSSDADLLMTPSENKPKKVDTLWEKSQRTAWGSSALAVRTTITSATEGAGRTIVQYSSPNV